MSGVLGEGREAKVGEVPPRPHGCYRSVTRALPPCLVEWELASGLRRRVARIVLPTVALNVGLHFEPLGSRFAV